MARRIGIVPRIEWRRFFVRDAPGRAIGVDHGPARVCDLSDSVCLAKALPEYDLMHICNQSFAYMTAFPTGSAKKNWLLGINSIHTFYQPKFYLIKIPECVILDSSGAFLSD
jgi:hypothetical protein